MIGKTNTGNRLAFSWRQLTAGIAVISLTAAFPPSLAKAQDEASSSDIAAARELAVEGLKLADAGHCAQAIDKLARAEKLRHSPIVLDRLGECQIEAGKIVEGTEDLRKVLREVLPANPSPNLLRARERAQIALNAAKPKIAILNISIQGAGENVTVSVDGQLVPSALHDRDRPTDPGEHDVDATAPGYIKESRHVTLGPGEKQSVILTLRQDPASAIVQSSNAAKPSEAGSSTTGASPPIQAGVPPAALSTRRASGPNRTVSYVLWVIGGAAVSAGSAFGVAALVEKKDLARQCPGNSCPASSRGALDSANRNATISTIFIGTGAASLAVGTLLFFTAGSNRTTEISSTSYRPHAWVGLGRVGIDGNF